MDIAVWSTTCNVQNGILNIAIHPAKQFTTEIEQISELQNDWQTSEFNSQRKPIILLSFIIISKPIFWNDNDNLGKLIIVTNCIKIIEGWISILLDA